MDLLHSGRRGVKGSVPRKPQEKQWELYSSVLRCCKLKRGAGRTVQVVRLLLEPEMLKRNTGLLIAVVASGFVAAVPLLNGPAAGQSRKGRVSTAARLVAIRRAQVWAPTNIPTMDLKAGPQGPGAFAPNEMVNCEYDEDKTAGGHSPKFDCKLDKTDKEKDKEKDKNSEKEKDKVKVKYGKENGEVYAEVATTRLLWALGFGADRMYPVRVLCRKCPADPAANAKKQSGETLFDPAAIEREADGEILESQPGSGWAWPELDLVEETVGGAPLKHRDALKLLAVFLQHTDSKPEQQRLMCLPGEKMSDNGEPCLHTFMMLNDVGLTFGHANQYNRNSVGSTNFEQWTRVKVWSDPKACIGDISRSQTGTLDHPQISEAGRKFLADLLVQLTDAQLHDLFAVARFPERTGGGRQASVDEWVGAFKQKRDEIVNTTCPQ
jgi:hypothetical protein